MPLSPPRRRRALHAGNHALANADQNLTEVDTRLTGLQGLTKVDTVNPRPNPSGASRTNLNNPEQIRTNLNAAKRPDQIGRPPESPLITPKKRNLNTVVAHSFPSFLRRQEPTHPNTPHPPPSTTPFPQFIPPPF